MSTPAPKPKLFCAACGPKAEKCLRRNPACDAPKTLVSAEARRAAQRAYLLLARKSKLHMLTFVHLDID